VRVGQRTGVLDIREHDKMDDVEAVHWAIVAAACVTAGATGVGALIAVILHSVS